jgi:hypothetical protein
MVNRVADVVVRPADRVYGCVFATGRLTFLGHSDEIGSLALRGYHIARGSVDPGAIEVIDLRTGRVTRALHKPELVERLYLSDQQAVAFFGNSTPAKDVRLFLWDGAGVREVAYGQGGFSHTHFAAGRLYWSHHGKVHSATVDPPR